MKFDAALRMAFESRSDDNNLNRIILGGIAKLDGVAAMIREANEQPGAARVDVAEAIEPKVVELVMAATDATRRTVAEIRDDQAAKAGKWELDRQRHADRSLLQIKDAEMRIGAMTDEQAEQAVYSYGEGSELNPAELNLLRIRLNRAGNEALLSGLNAEIGSRRGLQPWIRGETLELAHRADALADLPAGEMLLLDPSGSGDSLTAKIENLIDVEGELDEVS
jgi:hypothetical protein